MAAASLKTEMTLSSHMFPDRDEGTCTLIISQCHKLMKNKKTGKCKIFVVRANTLIHIHVFNKINEQEIKCVASS